MQNWKEQVETIQAESWRVGVGKGGEQTLATSQLPNFQRDGFQTIQPRDRDMNQMALNFFLSLP